MNRIVIFLVIVYLVSAFGAWALFTKNTGTNISISTELDVTKKELADTKNALTAQKEALDTTNKKLTDARANVNFLELALCPTLEATNKEALCVKDGTAWLEQTILTGTTLTSPDAKIKMDTLLVALSKPTKPTAKQLYEMLRPVELDALKALTENLK